MAIEDFKDLFDAENGLKKLLSWNEIGQKYLNKKNLNAIQINLQIWRLLFAHNHHRNRLPNFIRFANLHFS